MGQSHSVQYNQMVRKRQQKEWKVVQQHHDLQIWQNNNNGKRFAVYPFEFNQNDTEQNIQMLHFRKLNHLHLVSAQTILKNNDEALCSNPKGNVVLLQHIPVRLIQINNKICFSQRLSILASTFAGLHTLNFIFGPLFIWEDMIGFNQEGKTKIWINKLFFLNQPSRLAKGEPLDNCSIKHQEQMYYQEEPLSDLMINCVTQVFKTVGNSQIQTYPMDFRQQASKIRNFMEGEEFVHNYCRTHNIELKETISCRNYLHDPDTEFSFTSRMSMQRGIPENVSIPSQTTYVQSSRLSSHHYQPNAIYNQPTERKLSIQQPRANFDSRSSISKTKVTINYGGQTKRSLSIQSSEQNCNQLSRPINYPIRKAEVISMPIQRSQTVSVSKQQIRPKQIRFQNNHMTKQQNNIIRSMNIPIQPVVSRQVIESTKQIPIPIIITKQQNNLKDQNISLNTLKTSKPSDSKETQSKSSKLNQQKQEIKNDLAQLFNNDFYDSSQPQTQKLVSECLITDSAPIQNESMYGTVNTIDEIKMWEASLLMKLSSKKQAADINHHRELSSYQSCEQDTINAQSHRQSYEKANDKTHQAKDMEEYVRYKYKQYINIPKSNEENIYSFGSLANQPIKPLIYKAKRQQQRKISIDHNIYNLDMRQRNKSQSSKYLIKKPVLYYADIIHEQTDRQSKQQSESTMKYGTFGKIEYDVNPFCSQNFKLFENEHKTKMYIEKKRSTSINDNILEQRYKKYVSNKQTNKNKSSNYLQVPSIHRVENHSKNYLKDSKEDKSSFHREVILKKQMRTPTKHQKIPDQPMGGTLTYTQLRQFLRN